MFGSKAATSFTAVTPDAITAVAPAGTAGSTVDVVVTSAERDLGHQCG